MEVNTNDLLYFENPKINESKGYLDGILWSSDSEKDSWRNFIEDTESDHIFEKTAKTDFRESIGISFKVNSKHLFGIPERAERSTLKVTDHGELYRLYNLDIFKHEPYSKQSLYGSIPYITAHTKAYDVSFLWLNSAETWVNIMKGRNQERVITWLSEAGKMEFFLFGSSLKNGGPKQIYKHLADITGYSPLPPYFSLGFHYSKWEDISTERMTELLEEFNERHVPVDVFWLDIGYTDQNKYFELEYSKFRDIKHYVKKIQE